MPSYIHRSYEYFYDDDEKDYKTKNNNHYKTNYDDNYVEQMQSVWNEQEKRPSQLLL